jgi:hypothetical protein
MSWITSILSFFTNPVADLTGGYRERKRIASMTAANEATAETLRLCLVTVCCLFWPRR